MSEHLYALLDSAKDLFSLAVSLCGLGGTRTDVFIGGRQYQVERSLGEGGFSHVLLVSDVDSGAQYALKTIVCHTGTDALDMAQREIEAGRRFNHPNIVSLVDAAIGDGEVPNAQTAYMVFPVYRQGSLLELRSRCDESGERLTEEFIVAVFRGVCRAVAYLHGFTTEQGPSFAAVGLSTPVEDSTRFIDTENEDLTSQDSARFIDTESETMPKAARSNGYAGLPQAPPTTISMTTAISPSSTGGGPYAHRDIKLGNVMLQDDGQTPILMDFGSCRPARVHVTTRTEALCLQDDAAENCSLPYRAPELFDIPRDTRVDERTDVWSLGCTLFALAFGYTPFEDPRMGPGASIALAATNANYRYPDPSPYSERISRLVDFMLQPDPATRPFIGQVIALVDELYPAATTGSQLIVE